MKITFFDRQNASNPLNTTVITTTTELLDILDGLKGRSAFFCELVVKMVLIYCWGSVETSVVSNTARAMGALRTLWRRREKVQRPKRMLSFLLTTTENLFNFVIACRLKPRRRSQRIFSRRENEVTASYGNRSRIAGRLSEWTTTKAIAWGWCQACDIAILPSSSVHGPFLTGDDRVRLALP